MNHMRIPLFLIPIVLANPSIGQPVFPVSADSPQWNILAGYTTFALTDLSTVQWTVIADTSLCGVMFEMAYGDTFPFSFYRIEGDRVHLRTSTDCDQPEFLLYDFGLSIGDTVLCASDRWGELISTPFWVTGIDTVNVMGIERQRLLMNYFFDPNEPFSAPILEMQWVRGMGSLTHPFHPVAYSWNNGHSVSSVLCYWEEQEQLYDHPFYYSCDTSYTIAMEIEDPIIEIGSIFPNPFSETTTIQFDRPGPAEVQVLSIDGKLLSREIVKDGPIEIGADLAIGQYIFKLVQGSTIQAQKVVKLE